MLSYTDKVTTKVVFFTVLALFAIPFWFISGGTILGYIAVRLVAKFFHTTATIGHHRWLSHNSFKPNIFGKFLMLFSLVISGFGKPLHLVIAHRAHHVNMETENDPHSPLYVSKLDMWLGKFRIPKGAPVPRDFFRDKQLVWVNNNYWKLFFAFNVILAIIDLPTALIFCPVTIFNLYWGFIIINYYGHNGNAVNKEDVGPINLHPAWAIIAHGEELHKNHHDNPNSYHYQFNGRIDVAKPYIEHVLIQK